VLSLVRARAGRLVRFLVAAVLTSYLLWRADPAAVVRAAANADPAWILLAVMLVFVDRALMAQRWIALLCILEKRPPLGRLIEIFLTSTFLGTFLPASVGGDAVRAYSLTRSGFGVVSGADAIASVFMDRMLGVAALLLMSLVGLLFAREMASNAAIVISLMAAAAACAATIALVFSERFATWSLRLLSVLPIAALGRGGNSIVDSIRRYASHRRQLFAVLASSIGVQVLRIVQAYCLGRAIGVEAGPAVYFAFIPLILLVMLLPVTINGLGTAQLVFIWFFARVGVASATAFALSILFIALGSVGNLPGAVIYATRRSASSSA
jgi:hypothetical protein